MFGKCTASDPSLITAKRTRDDGEGNKTIRGKIETRDESARALICSPSVPPRFPPDGLIRESAADVQR